MKSLLARLSLKTFCKKEDGAGTVFSLFMLIVMMAMGGVALDVQNVVTARTDLQLTSDAVAHAALLSRENKSEEDAKVAAIALARANMPLADVGAVINAKDIVFGAWNAEDKVFTAVPGSRSAVQVTAYQNSGNSNPIATFLLRIVGFDNWNVSVSTTFTTYHPTCLREGFVAEGVVDLQSNNTYKSGFCIHSNEYVSLNSNNTFEPGTSVSMPDLDDLELPNSGYRTNIGLKEALVEGSWNVRILNQVTDIVAGITNRDSKWRPSYLTSTTIQSLPDRLVEEDDLVEGRVHTFTCDRGNTTLTIDSDVEINRVAIITNCEIKFNADVEVVEAVIISTSTAAKAITSVAGLKLGTADNCAPGGEAQLVTYGSMEFPSALSIYGSQLLALGNITFSANGDGLQGAAMVAGGEISGTSRMTMALCGNQENANFQVDYFKMVN